jgi:hypothetical protein
MEVRPRAVDHAGDTPEAETSAGVRGDRLPLPVAVAVAAMHRLTTKAANGVTLSQRNRRKHFWVCNV